MKAERIQKIKEIVFDRKQVDVITLASLLNVSDVTVRSDLEQLEASGFIIRTHGGAVLNESALQQGTVNDSLSCKNIEYDKNREEIGKIAEALIQEREWVFLGPGETCYYIAKELLSRKNINILTNNCYVINVLYQNPTINVFSTAGRFNRGRFCLFDNDFQKSIQSYYFSKAFFTVGGVDMNAGYTVSDSSEAEMIAAIAPKTKELIIAADHRKFDNISFMQIGNLDTFDTIITNDKLPTAYKKYYTEKGKRVYTTYNLASLVL